MRRWIWVLALGGCADSNIGEWEGETFDCVDPAMDQRGFVARLVYEPMNGVGSHDFELDDELLAVGDGCNLLHSVGLGLEQDDPVKAIRQWRCDEGVIELRLESTGSGDQRQAVLVSQARRGTDRDPPELVCNAEITRR